MRQKISNTEVQITSFAFFQEDDRGETWEYSFRRKATGQWTVTRRPHASAPIPPFMQILTIDGFEPVIGNKKDSALFHTVDLAVRFIEVTAGRTPA